MPHYLIVDCESDKLFDYSLAADAPGQPRLAQLGLIFANHNLEVEREVEFLIKPEGWEMSAEATEKTGLTTDYLKEHGTPVAEAMAIYDAGIAARRVVAGFNISFDLKLCRAELRRAGMQDRYMETRNLCLMWGTRSMVGALDSRGKVKVPNLEEACAFFGIEQEVKHRALPDAQAVLLMMRKLQDMGALPEPKSPYDKKSKKPKGAPTRKVGLDGDDPELEIPT